MFQDSMRYASALVELLSAVLSIAFNGRRALAVARGGGRRKMVKPEVDLSHLLTITASETAHAISMSRAKVQQLLSAG